MARTLLLFILLTLSSAALASTAPAAEVAATSNTSASEEADTSASTEDMENMIRTLEDPAARDALIKDLQVLMEARAQGTPDETEVVGVTDLWQWVRESASDTWSTIANTDPRHILISCLLSVAVLLGAFLVRWLVRHLLVRLYARLGRVDHEHDTVVIPPTLTRTIDIILLVLSIVLIVASWGVNVSALMQTDLGARSTQMILSIGFLLAITMAIWHAADIMIERGLRSRMTGSGHERHVRRTETLIPLVRTTVRITIGILAALLLLSEIGVNIGPLLAGAGILGLAIGFGAQTLVKDLIGGVTILLEDAASLGDVVETGGHIGMVEDMRIRVLQLRDLAGVVHVIPYSEVAAIKNYTKDYSYYVFDVGVAYREDTDEVVKVLTELAEEFRQDETYKDMILEPLEILGVNEFADSAVIIKVRLKTTPGQQWTVGREFNRRIKKRFDELNIEIPFPHTTLYIGEPKQGQPAAMPLTLAEKEGKLLEKWATGENG